MKYLIKIESNKNRVLIKESEFYEKSILIDAVDCCEAVGIAMKESSFEKIDSIFLPLSITISEAEQI
jgi:hypothetical protein